MWIPTVKDIEQIVKQPDKLLTINEDAHIAEAAKKMSDNQVGCLLVFDTQNKFVGVLTERDMIAKVLATSSPIDSIPARDIMSPEIISCGLETTINEVEQLMAEHKIRHVPIVENGAPTGIISSRDTIAYRLQSNTEMKAAAEQLAMLSTGLKSLDFDDVISLTINEVPKNLEAERAILYFAPKGHSAVTIYRKGCPLSDETLSGPEQIKKLSLKKQTIRNKICNECEILGGRAPGLVIPLSIEEQYDGRSSANTNRQGFLCMCRFNPSSAASAESRLYKASLLREALSVNLTNANLHQNYQKARRDSEIDPLTGVGSRRVLEQILNTEYARALRYNRRLSIGVVDVDNFKLINDNAGHAAGDRVLRKLAEIMCRATRTTDIIIIRYGGDEFVLIMPETKLSGARILLERLRRQVRTVSIPAVRSITISCGAAEWTGSPGDTIEEVLKRADDALYKAKRSGRNRVIAGLPVTNKI